MAVSSLLIDLPRIYALLFRFDDPLFLDHTLLYTDRVARPLLALFLIFFSIDADHPHLPQRDPGQGRLPSTCNSSAVSAWQLSWFLLVAAIHLFGLALLNRTLLLGFGGDSTSAGFIWSFVHPFIAAFLAAWLLSSWVSLYKRCETGRVKTPDWIPF